MKTQWSGFGITAGSGKLGGDVAARNRAGPYLRVVGPTVNPSTSYQVAWRTRLTTYTQMWPTLTANQIDAWNRTRRHIPRSRFLPSEAPCTGQKLFIRVNSWRDYYGIGALVDPVEPVQVTPATWAVNLFKADLSKLIIDVVTPSNYTTVAVWITPLLSPGIRFFRPYYRLIAIADTSGGPDISLDVPYSARFSPGSVGDAYSIILVPIDPLTASFGPPFRLDGFATL